MKITHTKGFKKFIVVLCMLCMVCMTCYGTMFVHAQGDIKLTASSCRAERGKTAAVTVDMQGNSGLWGMKCKIGYDHSALELVSAANGSIFSEEDVVLPESLNEEKYIFLATAGQLEDIQENGNLLTLNFQVKEDADIQDYPITLEVTQAIDVDGKELDIVTVNGIITVDAAQPPKEDNPPKQDNQQGENNSSETGNLTETENPSGSVEAENQPVVQKSGNEQASGSKTGDTSKEKLWIALACFSGTILLTLGIYMKKRNGQRLEKEEKA